MCGTRLKTQETKHTQLKQKPAGKETLSDFLLQTIHVHFNILHVYVQSAHTHMHYKLTIFPWLHQ